MFAQGAAADLAWKNPDRAAAKFAALADVELQRGRKAAAIAAAEKAIANSNAVKIRFLAARSLCRGGRHQQSPPAHQRPRCRGAPGGTAGLRENRRRRHRARKRDTSRSDQIFTEANALLDTWIGRLELGRAYLEAGAFTQADSEFDRCIKRRGEALSLFLDEEPTYGYVPQVYDYLGLAREGMGRGAPNSSN